MSNIINQPFAADVSGPSWTSSPPKFSECDKRYKWLYPPTWWRHQMEIISALLAICAGNSPVTGEFPPQRPVTRSFDVYFDLRPNERLSKQWWGWWFETLSRSLWRHRNEKWQHTKVLYQLPTPILLDEIGSQDDGNTATLNSDCVQGHISL